MFEQVRQELRDHLDGLGVSDEVAIDIGYPISVDEAPRATEVVGSPIPREAVVLGLASLPGARAALQQGRLLGHMRSLDIAA